MIYLASPYTHDDPAIKHSRYRQASLCTAHFARIGISIFSPIHYGHTLSTMHERIPHTHEYWMTVCLPILRGAERIYVLTIPGWKESKGIRDELDEGEKLELPVVFVQPDFTVWATNYILLRGVMEMPHESTATQR